MSDRIVESLNEMKQIYLESVSGQVVSERDEYLQYIEEKMKKMKKKDDEEEDEEDEEDEDDDENQDYDGDGEIESGEDEHAGSVHNAIQRKLGGIPDGNPPKRRKKSMKESFSDWRGELYEKVGDVEADIEDSKNRKIEEKSGIKNKIDINPNVNIGEQVELSEEYIEEVVDIAAQYFYEQGLNEDGVQILIDNIGHEAFCEWVFEISDHDFITERRLRPGETALPARTREKITGKPVSRKTGLKGAAGKAKEKSDQARRDARKAARKEAPEMTTRQKTLASLQATQRQRNIDNAKGKQSKAPTTTSQSTSSQERPEPRGLARLSGQVAKRVGDFVRSPETMENIRGATKGALNKMARDIMTTKYALDAAKKTKDETGSLPRAAGRFVGTIVRGAKHGVSATGVREEIEAFLLEKSESQQQQKLFGLALSVKRGETPRSEVSKAVLDIVDGMSEKEIRKFAKTPHKGLPKKVED